MPLSTLRIIAGQFRSRKITFEAEAGLRPTHDRIRETVFNWLQPVIEKSDCLDVFAGSGAMGFEALSRGANHVTFCDISKNVITHLKKNAESLKINKADFCLGDFIAKNTVAQKQFDIVFVDPPFQKNLFIKTCELLVERNLLKPKAFIYGEFEKNAVDFSLLPKQWELQKHKKTGMIEYVLLKNQ